MLTLLDCTVCNLLRTVSQHFLWNGKQCVSSYPTGSHLLGVRWPSFKMYLTVLSVYNDKEKLLSLVLSMYNILRSNHGSLVLKCWKLWYWRHKAEQSLSVCEPSRCGRKLWLLLGSVEIHVMWPFLPTSAVFSFLLAGLHLTSSQRAPAAGGRVRLRRAKVNFLPNTSRYLTCSVISGGKQTAKIGIDKWRWLMSRCLRGDA